jgi:glycosyltransferase involved in cell wall biosynthesis
MTDVHPPASSQPDVLVLADPWPWPPDSGGAQRVYHTIEALSRAYRVRYLSAHRHDPRRVSPPADVVAELVVDQRLGYFPDPSGWWAPIPTRLARSLLLQPPFHTRLWMVPAVLARLRELARGGSIALVWARGVWAAEAARRAGFPRIVVDSDDRASEVMERLIRAQGTYSSRWAHEIERRRAVAYERRLTARFARVIVASEEDRAAFGLDASSIHVVPNGIQELAPADPAATDGRTILFVGLFRWPPNADAALHFARDILPSIRVQEPSARFVAVGKEPPAELRALHDGVTIDVPGYVDDLAPIYDRAAVVVAPIREGSGTRIKVLEALGRAKATVSTSMGAEGLEVRAGEDLEIADHVEPFAEAVVRLLREPARRDRLAKSGRERVLEKYSWRRIGEVVRGIARDVLADAPRG